MWRAQGAGVGVTVQTILHGFDRRIRRPLEVPYLNLRYPEQPGGLLLRIGQEIEII